MAKKLLAMLLAVVMAFSLLPVSALAAELETGENEPAAEEVFEETDVIPPAEEDEPALPEEEAIPEDIPEDIPEELPAEEAEETSPDEEIPEEDEALAEIDTNEQALRDALQGDDTWIELKADITLSADLTVPNGYGIKIQNGYTFTVPQGKTLTNFGEIQVEGSLVVNGTYSSSNNAMLFAVDSGAGLGTINGVDRNDYETAKNAYFDRYSDCVDEYGIIDFGYFKDLIDKDGVDCVWVNINGCTLAISEDLDIDYGVNINMNGDWNGNNAILVLERDALVTVHGNINLNQDVDLDIDGFVFSPIGCWSNYGDYYYNCDNRIIDMNRDDGLRVFDLRILELILDDINGSEDKNRRYNIAIAGDIGVESELWLPSNAEMQVEQGCTLSFLDGSELTINGSQLIVAGKLIVTNGAEIDKLNGGRIVIIGDSAVVQPEYLIDSAVLCMSVGSEAELRSAISAYLNGNFSEAWLDVEGDTDLVVSSDLTLPEGCSLNFHEDRGNQDHPCSTLTVTNGARFVVKNWINVDGDWRGRFAVDDGTIIILSDIGFDPNAIVCTGEGRAYDFGNNGGQVGLRDQRDMHEVIAYSEYIHDAYIWMEGDITIDSDFVIGDYTIATGEGNTLTVAEGVHVKNCGRIDLRGTLDVLGTFDNSEGVIYFVSANAKVTGNGPDANCKRIKFLEIFPESEYTIADVVAAMEAGAGYDEVWVDLYKPLTLSQDLVIPGNAHIAFFEGGKLTVTGSSEVRCYGGLQYLNGENCIVLQNTSVLAFYGWQNDFRDDDEMQSVLCEDDALFLDYTRGGVWVEDAGLLCKAVEFAPPSFCMIMAAGSIVLDGNVDLTIPAGCNIIVIGELSLDGAKVINNGQIQVYGVFDYTDAGEFTNNGELLACSEDGENFGTIRPEEGSKKNITVSSGDFDKLKECIDGIANGTYDSVFFNVDGETLNITDDITIPEGMTLIVNSAGGDNFWSEGRVKVSWCTLSVEGEIIISEDCKLEVDNGGRVVIEGLSNIYSNRYYRDYRIEGSGSVELFLDNAGLEDEDAEQTFRFLTGWEPCFVAPCDGWYSFAAVEGEGLPVRSLDMFVGDEQLSGTTKRVLNLSEGDTISMMVQLYGGDASMETDLKIRHLSEDEVNCDYTINTGAPEDITVQNGVIWEIPIDFTAPDPKQSGYDGYYVGTFLSTDPALFDKGDGANWVETDSNGDIPRDTLLLQYFNEPAPDGKLTVSVLGPVPGMTYYYASAIFYMGADGPHVCGGAIETEPKSFTVPADAEITDFAVNDEAGLWPNDVMLAKFTAADAGQYIARLSGNGFLAMRDSTGLSKDFQEYYNDQTPGSADTVFDAAANDTFYITVFPTSRSQFTVISAADTKNKVKAGSNSMKDSVLYSFTSEADSIATFSFAGTKNLNSFSIFRNGQWFDFGYGKDTATLAFTDAETVYVKASVEGAEEQTPVKLRITNSALAMNAGLTVIAYPLDVEDPDFEYLRNIVPISNDGYFTDSDNWESFAIYSNVINKADPDKAFTLYPLILDSTYRVLNVDNPESTTATGALANVKFKWSVSGASVATVKQAKNENIATLTLKKGVAGVALVSATTTDKLKVAGSMAVHIMDYAPRLDSAKLTMNTFLSEPYAVTGLHPSYPEMGYGIIEDDMENNVIGIEVHEYIGKTVSETPSERFTASFDSAAEELIIRPADNTDVIANSSTKLQLWVNHFNGAEPSLLDVTVTVKNTMPTFSVKTEDPVNYAQGIGGLLFISSNDIMNKVIQLGESQFEIESFNNDDSDLTGISLFVNYGDGSQIWDGVTKIVNKTTLRVTFGEYKPGYNTVDKVVSIGCNKNAPSIKLDAKEIYFNKNYDLDDVPYVGYDLVDAGKGVEVAVTPSGKLRTDAFEVSDFYGLVFDLKDGCELPANGKYAYTVQLVKDGQPVKGAKAASVTLIVTDAQPKVTLKASGKLDLIDPEYSGILYQMKLSNFDDLRELKLGGPDADMFRQEGLNLIKLKPDKEYSTKKTYNISFTPVLGDGTQLAPINQKVKVTQSALKLLVTPKQNLFYQTKGRDKTLEYTISVASPAGGKIDWDSINVGTVKFWQRSLYDSTKDINFRLNGDCTELTVYITLKDTAKLKAGSYTLPIELTPMFAQDGTKPVKANLTMKVVK